METLAGRYVLEERLGSGGTATVWKATDTRLGVTRAVKLLDVAHGPERDALRERLRAEARAMAQVVHPHVVAVHDVGEDGDRDFIVMDLVDGPSLADALSADGPMDPAEAVSLMVEVLQALGAAHREGLVHRDVKPGNVLIASTGEARLCDFGIALAEASDQRNTKTGVALGSLSYMAPEQRRDARSVGPQADLYGVGCTLYNALTCATPVDLYLAPGRSPRWAAVPESLVAVIRRATAADPTDRYVDAASMSKALLRAEAPDDSPDPTLDLAGPEQTQEVERPATRRVPGVLWVNLGLTFVVFAIAFGMVYQLQTMVSEVAQRSPPAPSTQLSEVDVNGGWRGRLHDEWTLEMTLEGDDEALRGEVRLLGSVRRTAPVHGRFDRETGVLTLVDQNDGPGAGRYEATWQEAGAFVGQFTHADRDEALPFVLMRAE